MISDKILDQVKKVILSELSKFRWDVIGFVDKQHKVYPMTTDTKVLSKIFEMKVMPFFNNIAKKLSEKDNPCQILFAKEQNQYPDISVWGGILGENKIAIDIKSAYRISKTEFSGFTLGAFNGYFKNRHSTKNIVFPYEEYVAHWILSFLYERNRELDVSGVWDLKSMGEIPVAITNVEIILQAKWKVATTSPGSGNTANIGGIRSINDLKEGNGPFAELGPDVFDDYWTHYVRKEDCSKIGLKNQPYKNLETYQQWLKQGRKGANLIEEYYGTNEENETSDSNE